MRNPRVYVAGPYSKGDPVVNVAEAVRVGTFLLQNEFTPYVPHLTMFWHFSHPQPYEVWLNFDFEWVRVCDALLRLEGESSGADREILCAVEAGIPVFYSLDSLMAWRKTWRGE